MIEKKITDLEKETSKDDFWKNPEQAKEISKELNGCEKLLSDWRQIEKEVNDEIELINLAEKEKQTESILKDLKLKTEENEKRFNFLKIELFFSDPYDKNNAILMIHAGTGGVDAQDWAEMLSRMYLRFAEKNNFVTKIFERNSGDEAGIKSIIFEVSGPFAYGFLKGEKGVHRLVRRSPFNAQNLRQTSFALVEVIPEIAKDEEIEIKPEDLKIETFRSSGPGGQHANVTSSAVRITHIPTGIKSSSQNERSQFQNKESSLKILKSKLLELKILEEEKKIKSLKTSEQASWGNQIRSYVLHPYTLVKDHQTSYEESNVDDVLNGNLLPFIEKNIQKFHKKQKV